jgi:hypothetical protein
MKLRINCMQCFREQGQPSSEFQPVEITDDGRYRSKCSAGHTTLTILQNQKFEVLFDFGAMALIDGYPREAVTSMAAALERFYEFYITVTCLKHNIDKESFVRTWKHVASQSERQFGAYLFSHLIDHEGGEPPVIDNTKPDLEGLSKGKAMSWKEFRNEVVHKGYIPSISETLAYGNIVYRHICSLVADLKSNSGEFVQKAIALHLARAYEAGEGLVVSTMSIPTIISLVSAEKPAESLEKALEDVREYRKWLHHV